MFFVGFFGRGGRGRLGRRGGGRPRVGFIARVVRACSAWIVGSWVFAIIGAIQASKGVWWRYPVCVRFVKGAAPIDTPPLVGF